MKKIYESNAILWTAEFSDGLTTIIKEFYAICYQTAQEKAETIAYENDLELVSVFEA